MGVAGRWTSADLERIEPKETARYEIIDGGLYVSKQPSLEHQGIRLAPGGLLEGWSRDAGRGYAITAPGAIFSVESAVDAVRLR